MPSGAGHQPPSSFALPILLSSAAPHTLAHRPLCPPTRRTCPVHRPLLPTTRYGPAKHRAQFFLTPTPAFKNRVLQSAFSLNQNPAATLPHVARLLIARLSPSKRPATWSLNDPTSRKDAAYKHTSDLLNAAARPANCQSLNHTANEPHPLSQARSANVPKNRVPM